MEQANSQSIVSIISSDSDAFNGRGGKRCGWDSHDNPNGGHHCYPNLSVSVEPLYSSNLRTLVPSRIRNA